MADLIKKVKVMQSDGTFTDYIPLGADAANVKTEDGISVENKLKKKPYYFDTVTDMKNATYLKDGDYVVTLGYYEANDGGTGQYEIVDDDTLTDDGGSIIELGNGLKAKLIIKNNIINVKQFGAKANDNTFDNKDIFNKVLNFINDYVIYFPKGEYITSTIARHYINGDIEIFGDNAKIKLKDNCITADFQMLFRLEVNNNISSNIHIHGLSIDMNKTNNDTLIQTSGDAYALQHCHAIVIYPPSNGIGIINVNEHDLVFNDLIADGLSFATKGTGYFESIVVNNIISQGRHATRSDICVTGDFKNLLVTNCDLDRLEIEINTLIPSIERRSCNISNCITKQRMDLDITGSSNDIINISNCTIYGYLYWESDIINIDNCSILDLTTGVRCKGKEAYFNNCIIKGIKDETVTKWIETTDKQTTELHFNNCNVDLTNTNISHFIYSIINLIEVTNCNFKLPDRLIYHRGGTLILNHNYIDSVTSGLYLVAYSTLNASTKVYSRGNKTNTDVGLILMPINRQSTDYIFEIYDNNSEWAFGKSLYFSRYDKISSFNGGTDTLIYVREFTNYCSDAIPVSGYWIIGQMIKRTNNNGNSIGWICTSNGNGGTATFREINV